MKWNILRIVLLNRLKIALCTMVKLFYLLFIRDISNCSFICFWDCNYMLTSADVVQLQRVITADNEARRSAVDPAIHNGCADESVKTMMEICIRCLVKDPVDRPSIEDVLWNLQFAAQVQDAWHGDTQSSDGSPVSLVQPPHRQRNLQ